MSSVTVRAIPGSSVVVSSKDISLDASTLKFHIDQTGQTSFGLHQAMELFLNISCESSGPQGTNCIRISIESRLPQGSNAASAQTQRLIQNDQWTTTMDNVSMDPQSFNSIFLSSGVSHDAGSSYPPQSHSHSSNFVMGDSLQSLTMEPANMFNFDWTGLPTPSETSAESLSMMSFFSPEQLSKMDTTSTFSQNDPHSTSRPPVLTSEPASFTQGPAGYEHDTLSPAAKGRFTMLPSPPESSACSEASPEDKEMHSDSDSDEEKERERGEEMGDQDDDARRFPCRREGCDSRFVREYTRKLHEKTHKPKPPRVFTCSVPSCNVKTSRRHDLLRHEVRKHGKKSNWQCEFCQTFFSSEKTQERHTCSKKIIQTNKSGGSTGCWKLPRQPIESEHL